MTAAFVLFGSRHAIDHGLSHIEQQVTALERAITDNPALAFDLARTIIESVCKTILKERSIPYSDDGDLQRLFKTVTQHLPFLPLHASGEAEAREGLDRTIGALQSAVNGICQLRNKCGFASHGSESLRPPLEFAQALLAAGAADTIVGFLYRVHLLESQSFKIPVYEHHPGFNESIDETHGTIRVFESEFRPSEVLYQMERETYRIHLTEFLSQPEEAP